jgi:hypothetical protein
MTKKVGRLAGLEIRCWKLHPRGYKAANKWKQFKSLLSYFTQQMNEVNQTCIYIKWEKTITTTNNTCLQAKNLRAISVRHVHVLKSLTSRSPSAQISLFHFHLLHGWSARTINYKRKKAECISAGRGNLNFTFHWLPSQWIKYRK